MVAASHRTIFIIRPFVFSATVRPESNNSSPRRPRARSLALPSLFARFPFAADPSLSPAICFLSLAAPPLFVCPFFFLLRSFSSRLPSRSASRSIPMRRRNTYVPYALSSIPRLVFPRPPPPSFVPLSRTSPSSVRLGVSDVPVPLSFLLASARHRSRQRQKQGKRTRQEWERAR